MLAFNFVNTLVHNQIERVGGTLAMIIKPLFSFQARQPVKWSSAGDQGYLNVRKAASKFC